MSSRVFRITDGFGQVRFIGRLNGETLHMDRNRSEHFFRRLNAWCIDTDIFEQNDDISVIIITDKESDTK